jgi:hypothetical protein
MSKIFSKTALRCLLYDVGFWLFAFGPVPLRKTNPFSLPSLHSSFKLPSFQPTWFFPFGTAKIHILFLSDQTFLKKIATL